MTSSFILPKFTAQNKGQNTILSYNKPFCNSVEYWNSRTAKMMEISHSTKKARCRRSNRGPKSTPTFPASS